MMRAFFCTLAVVGSLLGLTGLYSTLYAQSPVPTVQPETATNHEGEGAEATAIPIFLPFVEAGAEQAPEAAIAEATPEATGNRLFIPAIQAQGSDSPDLSTTVAADLIFANGFDTGNLAAWTASVTDGNDLSAIPAARLFGSHGLGATVDDNNAIYVTDDTPAAEKRYRARFYFDPNSIRMSEGDTHFIFQGYSQNSAAFGVEFHYLEGKYRLRSAARSDNGTWRYGAWYVISDEARHVEIDWKAASVGGNNGYLTLWIENGKRDSIANLQNGTYQVDQVRLGAVADIDTGTRGQYYFDAFESRKETYIGRATNTPAPTATPTVMPTATAAPTSTPAPTATPIPPQAPADEIRPPVVGDPMAQRHPDAGVWVAYRGANTTADLQKPYIKGIMAYSSWTKLWTSTGSFNWEPLRKELDYIVNTVGKQAFVVVAAGYCPEHPWPAPLRAAIAESKTVMGQGCKPLQFYDPLYLTMYQSYIRALANELARFDSTDSHPNETNITFVRAGEMALTVETLPNDSDLDKWQWTDFNPAPNGRIYRVDLTKEMKWAYYQAVLTTYRDELTNAYAAVGLTPPAMPAADSAATHWGATPITEWVFDQHMLVDSHVGGPAPQGIYDDMYVGTQSLKTRATIETGGAWASSGSWLGQYSYWEALANLHMGVEFIGTYGTNRSHSALQPKGPVSWIPNQEAMIFADKYAGEQRNPAASPGVWIAFRGGYFEDNFSNVYMKRWIGNYEGGIQQVRVQDSVALYGLSHVEGNGQVNPIVKRSKAVDWPSEMTLCLKKYTQRECDPAYQPPDLFLGEKNGFKEYAYKTTDLGTVRWCEADMFCVGGTATRTEKMPWARRTNGQPIRLDINDAFAASLTGPVQIRVIYLDQGSGQWSLLADGNSVLTVTKSGTNLWREATVSVPAGALDLALDPLGDGDDIFHLVEVTRN
ncbi:MAG: hypothetical protein IT328_17125 [Caldilineaceae bacterium]|nr:hypothetical protein [Caldilineaceae bacterium]